MAIAKTTKKVPAKQIQRPAGVPEIHKILDEGLTQEWMEDLAENMKEEVDNTRRFDVLEIGYGHLTKMLAKDVSWDKAELIASQNDYEAGLAIVIAPSGFDFLANVMQQAGVMLGRAEAHYEYKRAMEE